MNNVLSASKRFAKRNGSTILTGLGIIGVVGTAVLTAKASPKAVKLIEAERDKKSEELTKWEKAKIAAPVYIPAILMGTATIACIAGANILSRRAQASIASAYALLDQTHKEYKNKIEEVYGPDANKEIQANIAKDKYDETNIEENETPLFYDEFSKRYFNASNETILHAEYEINKLLSTNGAVSLNEYYELVGLPIMEYGDYLGWSSARMYDEYWDDWLYFHHTKVEMEDGLECHIIDYTEPFYDYLEY